MSSSSDAEPTRVVKGIINVQPMVRGELAGLKVSLEPKHREDNRNLLKEWFDGVTDDHKFLLELVSVDLNCKYLSKGENKKVKAQENAKYVRSNDEQTMFIYECNFDVSEKFGEIGAVLVKNEHDKEAYIKNIVLDNGHVTFTCESWINKMHGERIFFTNKLYLPSETPKGLKFYRDDDLVSLCGNGEGKRKQFGRIYDYDVYDNLGGPDTKPDLARPVLGGTKHPYPRRCRTGFIAEAPKGTNLTHITLLRFEFIYKFFFLGEISRQFYKNRKKTSTAKATSNSSQDPLKTTFFYTPRDEEFSDTKVVAYGMGTLYPIAENLVPLLKVNPGSSTRKLLYDECVNIIGTGNGRASVLRRLIQDLFVSAKSMLQMRTIRSLDEAESFSWDRDDEFCRQTLAGINPYSIRLVTKKDWPIKSKLSDYGPTESIITEEIVHRAIGSFMTIEEALEHKKLFMLDYHDLLLPFVNKVRELDGTTLNGKPIRTTLYGSRTLMFLTSTGTLKPVAIELTRPLKKNKDGKVECWRHVYTPHSDAWLWKLAKVHILAHDSCYHQLVSHWLRTHCVTEPYIIATHRCLSKMHPIHRLLSPHFRYTMQINALARQSLINAGGYIEPTFSLGKYSMQLSSDAYKQWRFDHEALPADLIERGMAVKDLSAPHGIKLTIEDYPFANDGLLLWDAIKNWATAYVNHYYPKSNLVESDEELKDWWDDIKTKGHEDKKDEPWWPKLKTQEDLIGIVTTIMWVASGHHSAVNFGQYTAGYAPYRPTIARTKMPNEDRTEEETKAFLKNPEQVLKDCLPSMLQSTTVIPLLDLLSSHSPDEEYIGTKVEAAWEAEPAIKAAFQDFSGRLKELEGIIDSRNLDPNLRNRKGRGSVPYQLLKPFSGPGATGKGVPYSISI
ncbi:hypothetical protein OSB04_010313 [Centaurea solstitialis]|uniref:Lipoxygenase n=1 Tax=Centaurea solstitialis TaxID=347529 RepID=A0AA38T901_9ASTR|nr:hypothetical protein OSB04_010313 [Centaurea solstitialis]